MESDYLAEALQLTNCPPGDGPLVALFEVPDHFHLAYMAWATPSPIHTPNPQFPRKACPQLERGRESRPPRNIPTTIPTTSLRPA